MTVSESVRASGQPSEQNKGSSLVILDLSRLAATINEEHARVGQALVSAVAHAMAAGDALLCAREQATDWLAWVDSSLTISNTTAAGYMRLARNRRIIEAWIAEGGNGSLSAARRILVANPEAMRGPGPQSVPPAVKVEAADLRAQGLPDREIAEHFGVSRTTIGLWLDPERMDAHLARERRYAEERRSRSAKTRRTRQQQDVEMLAETIGGELAASYGAIRRCCSGIEKTLEETSSLIVREGLVAALAHARRVEAAIVQALQARRETRVA